MKSPSVKAAHTSFKKNGRNSQRRIALKSRARPPYYTTAPISNTCRKLDFDILCNDTGLQHCTADELNCMLFENTCSRAAGMSYVDALKRVRALATRVIAENERRRRTRVVWCVKLRDALMAIPDERRSRCCNALIKILDPLTYWDGTCADVIEGSVLLLHLHQRASTADVERLSALEETRASVDG